MSSFSFFTFPKSVPICHVVHRVKILPRVLFCSAQYKYRSSSGKSSSLMLLCNRRSLHTVMQAYSSLLFSWSTDALALALRSRQVCKLVPLWLPVCLDLPPVVLILLLVFLFCFPASISQAHPSFLLTGSWEMLLVNHLCFSTQKSMNHC